uniref:Moesin/ezrin/radixin homolog 1 n=1 Tax=Ascaris suum TaxID=6253 RepID=F1KU02_ASCSU
MGKGGTATTDSPPAERPADENPANDSNMQPATVHLLDATKQIFYVPKKAEGKELFDKVVDYLKLVEKEYFGLSFLDTDGNRHWIYEDKRIAKQLKGHPWEFNFEVKFYPPDPATLTDDLTRYHLTLQIRHDVYTGRLPATFATLALLGSYIAQAERGDFQDTPDYDDFLRDCRLAPVPSSALYEKIRELHKQHKGETPAEAELHYLDNAKKLSMYGVFLFPAKDSKGTSVHVGVCAHGINVYCDQIRAHRFIWQNIIKIAYRRNTFSIKLQPGELDRSAVLFHLKVPDYASAKRIWKCAVEHHTFFRLIQPDEKPHKGLFRWGSGRFRYQGRTHFQSKMASQMFDHPAATVKRSHSARLASRSDENLAPEVAKHTSPLHYADDGTSRDLTSTPEKSYTLHSVDISGKKDMKKIAKTSEVESVTKPSEKRETKKKNEKKKAKNAVDGGGSTSSSDSESKERQYRPSYAPTKENVGPTEQLLSPSKEAPMCEGPIPWTKRTVESNQVLEIRNEGANVPSNHMSDEQELTRTKEAEMFEGRILLEERVDNSYRIQGTGISPTIDPNDTESSAPHTTVESWHESNVGPESVVTDVDKYGNVIKKTVKTQQVKHTIQRQTYQTYSISGEGEQPGVQTVEASQQVITPIGGGIVMSGTTPIVETRSHTVAYEAGQEPFGSENGFQRSDIPGELISCRTISSGNRTVETITYKTEKDGIVEIHVEHRVTIHSGANIDHDAELSQAILEATNMNPDMTVEKIEVKQESQC